MREFEAGLIPAANRVTVAQAVEDWLEFERSNVSRLMGHSGTAVTELVYRHELRPVIESGASVMEAVFPALIGAPQGGDDDAS